MAGQAGQLTVEQTCPIGGAKVEASHTFGAAAVSRALDAVSIRTACALPINEVKTGVGAASRAAKCRSQFTVATTASTPETLSPVGVEGEASDAL